MMDHWISEGKSKLINESISGINQPVPIALSIMICKNVKLNFKRWLLNLCHLWNASCASQSSSAGCSKGHSSRHERLRCGQAPHWPVRCVYLCSVMINASSPSLLSWAWFKVISSYHLPMLHSYFQLQRVLHMSVYISFPDKFVDNHFQWSDGTPVTYTNWGTQDTVDNRWDCAYVSTSTFQCPQLSNAN